MASEKTYTLRREAKAAEPMPETKDRATFGRPLDSPTCRMYHCYNCQQVFSEIEVSDVQCPRCGARVTA